MTILRLETEDCHPDDSNLNYKQNDSAQDSNQETKAKWYTWESEY